MQTLRLIWYISHRSTTIKFPLACHRNSSNINAYTNYFLKTAKHLSLVNLSSSVQSQNIAQICYHSESKIPSCSVWKRFFSKTSSTLHIRDTDIEESEIDDVLYTESEEKIFEKWSTELLPLTGAHSVFVIQPYIKWGTNKKTTTTPELQLEESVTLVRSLHGWFVTDKMMIGLKSFKKKTFFGSGNFENLRKIVRSNDQITAVFISTKMLKHVQHRELEVAFGVPVFDRYTIVIHLFRQHAVTREAKLQVAMAEIPYIWAQLKGRNEGNVDKRSGTGGGAQGGGGGETLLELQKHALLSREMKIKGMLEKLRNHRKVLRSKREKLEYPIVAVVGYTNAGKTSLIKALTGDENMKPKNKLFATLDVSTHMGLLPSRMKVLYVDTIGFISDIPTNLLESFVATLEDALFADVIIHVNDVSHPDRTAQVASVDSTLQSLHLEPDILKNIIVVGNKIDLINHDLSNDENEILVSSVTFDGLNLLRKKIEEVLLETTNRKYLTIRVPMGGKEVSWLYKEATVTDTEADPDNSQYLLMHVIVTDAQLNRFKHYFIGKNSESQ